MVKVTYYPSARQPWTFASISTAQWLKASDTSTIVLQNNVFTAWNDKSGNGRNMTSVNATYEQNVINGLPAVRINNLSATQYLENTSFNYSGNTLTLFSVHKNLRASGRTQFGRLFSFSANTETDFSTANGIILTYGVTTGIALYRNFATIATTSAINNTWCLVDAVRNGSTGSVALNGGTRSTGTTSAANQGIQRQRMGNDTVMQDSGMNGWLAEQVVIFGVLDNDTMAKAQGRLAWDWGLQANLPADHPYRNAEPYI